MKSTKKSFLLSTLSVILCIAMLLGTTYAWFTDSVTSGKNRIEAGNLDVDMLYKSGTMDAYATVEGVTNNGDGTTPFFVNKDGGKILWEPGAMAYSHFKVANVGNLALQYNFALRITGMNALKTEGTKHNLSEVIKAVVLNTEVTGDDVKTQVAGKTWNSIEAFEDKGALSPTAEKYFTVVLYWEPTDHDNLYNVNNGQTTTTAGTFTNEDSKALYIDFDIQLTATQVPEEEDSFDKFYDNIELGLVPPTWSGESEPAPYNGGGTYEVKVENETKASVEVPAGAEDEDGTPLADDDSLKLVVEPGVDADVKIEAQNSMTTYDVSLVKVSDGKKVRSNVPMKVSLEVGDIDLIRFYHKGVQYENRKATEAEVAEVGDFYYSKETEKVIFMTKDFSPFTSEFKYAGGQGTTESPYKLANAKQLKKLADSKKFILIEDIDLTGTEIFTNNTYGFAALINRAYLTAINGDGHKISYHGQDAESVIGDNLAATIKNVTFDITCPVSGYVQQAVYDNVIVNGNMSFSNNTGIFGYYCAVKVDVKNCVVNANVQSSSYSAVFFGYNFSNAAFTVTDTEFNGTYVGPHAGLVLGNGHYTAATVTLNNVKNNGVIRHALINTSAKNPFFAMNDDHQANKVTLVYDGVTVGNKGTDAFTLAGDGQYVIGPEDTGLQVTINPDKTMSITKSSSEKVSYYEVEVISNVANIGPYGGSTNISVMETIPATGAATFTPNLKYFGFADGETASYRLADTWDIITIDGVDYYLDVDPDTKAGITSTDRTWINIRAYDANSKLISANVYNY